MVKQRIIGRVIGAVLALGIAVCIAGLVVNSAAAQAAGPSSSAKAQAAALPDLTIRVNPAGSDCNTVRFTVELRPQANPPSGTIPVRVFVVDQVYGVPHIVYDRTFQMIATGHRITATADFPMPADRRFDPDFENLLTVSVDPLNAIAESNEFNNRVLFDGTCIG